MFQHSIEHGQQLMHARGQSDFFDFPCGEEPLVKRFDLRVVARGYEGPHVEHSTHMRPPQIVRRPRRVPLSPLRGATPTKAAICCRVSVPNSGSSSNNVRAQTGPMPLALCNTSSFSRHRGLARSVVSRSWSSVAMAVLRHVIGAIMSCVRRARPRQAVRSRGAPDEQRLAAPQKGTQCLRLGVGQRPERRADHVGKVG